MSLFQPIIIVFVIFGYVIALTDVEQACINRYSEPLDNNFLIGTWYEVYKFALFLNLVPSPSCVKIVITKASPSDVQRYINAYRLENPYSFDDNPILLDRYHGKFKGMVIGHKQAKFFVYDPESVFFSELKYDARVYMKVNDDYMLFLQCSLRGHQKWLLSRKNSTTVEELDAVIKSIHPHVINMETQKFCA
ncbi:uncharacterized protein LOC124543689 [Vanessa cardui]|uniref:uncharacterized protein LOC124543689 n=1 Tax=Vanessa cardui TaxID=171605 RepID=UPI001F1410E8|nr:uncharacterized protein LOC124543689 [Vanessa cardui]